MELQKDRRVYEPAEDSWLLCTTLHRAAPRYPELRKRVLELGTGSGIVALTLAAFGASVTATDLNPHAVALAQRNASARGLDVEFLEGDLFAPVVDREFDAIVCNPPYLPPGGEYDDHWLALAVEGGPTGAEFTQRLLAGASRYLRSDGGVWLLFSSLTGGLLAEWACESFGEQDFDGEILRIERLSLSTTAI